ncbi:MAG: hypothetical protein C4537_06415 [Acholeplasma sp.]|jgi:hypothetical protein|nr:MAG: hypothetical protein C4537_06415 [Acholeplasma sp.]
MKKLGILCTLFVMSFMLTACNFSEHGELFDNDEKMLATGDTYSFLGMVERNDSIEFNRFSGIYTLRSFDHDGELTIVVSTDISSGRFKVIIVSDLDGIIELQEGTNQLILQDNRARLRVVGDDAKGSMSYSF